MAHITSNVITPDIVFRNNTGKVVATLKADGSVILGEGVTHEEAGFAFWQGVERMAPVHTHSRLLQAVRELAALKRYVMADPRNGRATRWTHLNVPTALLDMIDSELRQLK